MKLSIGKFAVGTLAVVAVSQAATAMQVNVLAGLTSEGQSCIVRVESVLSADAGTSESQLHVSLGAPFEGISSQTTMTITSVPYEDDKFQLTTSECSAGVENLYQANGVDWALASCKSGPDLSRVFVVFKEGTNLPRQIIGTHQGNSFSCVSID